MLSTWVAFRSIVALAGAIMGPYFVLFWFLLVVLWVPLFRERLVHAFGGTLVVDR
ncbi:MAG: hypothetical protein NTZ17_08540 [Phycisphaerae bacterium]|nr:hypothetical protein [Phycisphaerae bacterium]